MYCDDITPAKKIMAHSRNKAQREAKYYILHVLID